MNLVVLHGNLGADPEMKVAQSGMSILRLRIATSKRVKEKDSEQFVDKTEWHSVTVFGKRAEALGKILTKGDKVLIHGELSTTSYEKDGEKRYRTEILANDVELGGRGRGAQEGDAKPVAATAARTERVAQTPRPAQTATKPAAARNAEYDYDYAASDDIPF